MAQKTDTYLVDDVTGETLYDEPGECVRYPHGKETLEFDASASTAEAFRMERDAAIEAFNEAVTEAGRVYNETMAKYVAISRKAKGKGKGRKSTPVGPSREENKAIRERAKAAGVEVATRGRIPEDVKAQFSHA